MCDAAPRPAGGEPWGGPAIGAHPFTHSRSRTGRTAAGVAAVAIVGALLAAAAVAPAGAAAASNQRYQVRRGDTLSEVALHLGVSTGALAAANGIANPDRVLAGNWLVVPEGAGAQAGTSSSRHLVRPGEHLSGIAARFGLSVAALAQANGIADPNLVFAGRTLTIPSVGSSASSGSSGATAGSSELPSRLRESPSRLALMPMFDHWAAHYGVPADLLKAVTWLESGWQNGVVSSTGAVGIGQLMPSTVDHMSVVIGVRLNPLIPDQNIRMSARYLRLLLDVTDGRTTTALTGYYQGLGSVARNGVYPSTLSYVAGVMALRARF